MSSQPSPPARTTLELYRSLLFSIYLPSFLMAICQGSVILIIPLFALDLGASAGITALVFSLRGLGNMTVDIPAGWATSRLGDKTIMLTGVGLMGLTAALASQAVTPLQLGIAAFCFGAAVASWMLARLAHISEAVPTHQRGRAISSMAGLQRFGALIGPVSSGFVAELYGFEWVFAGLAVIAALTFILLLVSVKHNNRTATEESPDLLRLVPRIVSEHRKVFATAGLAILCLTVLRACRQLLIPLWGDSIGLGKSEIGLVVGLAASLDMVMFPIAGYTMDHLGRRYAAMACIGVLSLGLALVPLSTGFLTLVIFAMLAGAGNGLGSGINMTLGVDFAPAHQRGEFLGVWRLISDSGSLMGPVAVGYIASVASLASAFFAASTVGLVAIAIILFTVKETLQKTEVTATKHSQ